MQVEESSDPKAQGFVSFYQGLEANDPQGSVTTLRVFEQLDGEYYTAHGQASLFVADTFFNTRKVLKYATSSVPKVNIRPQKVRTIMEDCLLKRGISVELWRQAAAGDWEVANKASPGNLEGLSEFVFKRSEMTEAPLIMALHIGKDKVGQPVRGSRFVCVCVFSPMLILFLFCILYLLIFIFYSPPQSRACKCPFQLFCHSPFSCAPRFILLTPISRFPLNFR